MRNETSPDTLSRDLLGTTVVQNNAPLLQSSSSDAVRDHVHVQFATICSTRADVRNLTCDVDIPSARVYSWTSSYSLLCELYFALCSNYSTWYCWMKTKCAVQGCLCNMRGRRYPICLFVVPRTWVLTETSTVFFAIFKSQTALLNGLHLAVASNSILELICHRDGPVYMWARK